MFFFTEGLNVRWLVLVIDATFTSISINVGQLVDGESVLLVEGGAMQGFGSCDRLLRSLIFNESEPRLVLAEVFVTGLLNSSPFGHLLVVQRHEDRLLLRLPHGVELAQ